MRTLEQIKRAVNDTKQVTVENKDGEYIYKNGVSVLFDNRLEAEHYVKSLGYKLHEVKIRVAK